MNKKTVSILILIFTCTNYAGIGYTADIVINAAAPAKQIRMHNFYGGYHDAFFYFEKSTAYKRAHDLMKEISHKRPAFKYWRCQNIFTYRNDPTGPDGLRYHTEARSGHCYDTERYADTGGYNWTKVDEVYDEIVTRSGLRPIVEFNYMPECMAEDPTEVGGWGMSIISPPKDHNEWSDLCRNTVIHLKNRYGTQETRKWYWGVWNEPNYKEFWDFHKYGYDGFIKLYDYAAHPLKEVDNELKIGGPDNTAVLTYSKRFVEHTYNGTNYSSGEVGSPADYFSVHAYSTSIRFICSEAWKMARDVRDVYGEAGYADKKILVTETAPNAQMLDMPFFHTRFTAVWLLGLFDTFLEAADIHGEFYLPETILYCGFLRDFGRRSLMVHIGEDIDSDEVLKTAPFNVYEVMSLLSEERIPVQGCDFSHDFIDVTDFSPNYFNQVRCIATRTPGQSIEIVIYHFDQADRLVYNKKDDGDNPDQPYGTYKRTNPITHQVNLTLNNIPFSNAKYSKYVIDKDHSNSWAYRSMHGNTDSYSTLNNNDDLEQTENKNIIISNSQYAEKLEIQQNSITLIILENEEVEPGPRLGLSTTSLDFEAHNNTMSLSVYNYGDETLTWNAYENPDQSWITSIAPSTGSLNQGQNETVTITVDRAGMNDGDYSGTISISSNGGNEDVNISMHVGTPELPLIYRINAGAGFYTDKQGNSWSSDQAYTAGGFGYEGGVSSSTNDAILHTDDDPLYQSERYNLTAYRFDVPDGNYQIALHFAEIYFENANERRMSVAIEGQTMISDLDIFKEVGHDYALTYTFSDIAVTDGRVDITFSADLKVPKISAIEVINMNLLDPEVDNEPPHKPMNIQVIHP